MSSLLKNIQRDALKLTTEEKRRLIAVLRDSLADEKIRVEDDIAQELDRRVHAFESGVEPGYPADEVLYRLRQKLL